VKRTIALFLVCAGAGCEIPGEYDGAIAESEAEIAPRMTFTRTIPPAPASVPAVTWTPGMALVPVGYSPQSFWVVFAGKEGTTDRVEAAGFDVVGNRMLFSVDLATAQVDAFFEEVHGSITVLGLQATGHGIAGNVTPKCCKIPGTEFSRYAWGTAYVQHEADLALYR
jgi:hypothetical protein